VTTIVTLGLVSLGSVIFRLAPLLGAARVPELVARIAGWAGVSVLTAITVRRVLQHQDATTPAAGLVAAVAVGFGLLLALRGRSVLTVLVATIVCYSALGQLLRVLL
jgi:branched-subunit amino acid transport protein